MLKVFGIKTLKNYISWTWKSTTVLFKNQMRRMQSNTYLYRMQESQQKNTWHHYSEKYHYEYFHQKPA